MRAAASDVSICHYRLSRVEYDRAVEAGAFEPDARLELIDGNLHAMTPEGSRHAAVMDIVAHHLQRVFRSEFYIRIQHPLAVDDYSEPEPDIAVVRGAAHDYLDAHPTAAALIEVYRDPAGDGYRSVTKHAPGDKVAPLARPDAQIAVDNFLIAEHKSQR